MPAEQFQSARDISWRKRADKSFGVSDRYHWEPRTQVLKGPFVRSDEPLVFRFWSQKTIRLYMSVPAGKICFPLKPELPPRSLNRDDLHVAWWGFFFFFNQISAPSWWKAAKITKLQLENLTLQWRGTHCVAWDGTNVPTGDSCLATNPSCLHKVDL